MPRKKIPPEKQLKTEGIGLTAAMGAALLAKVFAAF
jgi:hypothetical protein